MFKIKQKAVTFLPNLKKPFEFKFNKINKSNYKFYYELIENYFLFPDNYFCIFIIDKMEKEFNFSEYFVSSWDAYIGYSKLIVKKNLKEKDNICLLADYHQKPVFSNKYYESEIKHCNTSQIYNVCMLESHASLFIQMVDVLIGSVAFDFKNSTCVNKKPNKLKKSIVDFVKKKLKVKTLSESFTKYDPNYFSVWKFIPNKNAGCQRS